MSQAEGLVFAKNSMALRVPQADVLAYVRGRIQNPKLRAWTFTLDGHDFYVLRLGMDLTLVYDVYSEQWMDWDAFGETLLAGELRHQLGGANTILSRTRNHLRQQYSCRR
jgi:hypothetical protein